LIINLRRRSTFLRIMASICTFVGPKPFLVRARIDFIRQLDQHLEIISSPVDTVFSGPYQAFSISFLTVPSLLIGWI